MTRLRIAGLQMDIAWEDRAANFEKVREHAGRARDAGVDLLVLPEMFSTGFSMNPGVTGEPPDGETPAFMKELAATHGMVIVGGYVQRRRQGRGANAALAVGRDGAVLSEYFKTHLFRSLGEHEVHEAGAGPRPFSVDGVEMACFVCYDLRFPEIFRMVVPGASLIMVIASWPDSRRRHWDILLQARAVENQLFVVGVNRVGEGGGLRFDGGTVIVDPMGNTVAAGGEEEGLVMADLDMDLVAETRARMPFLQDRRF
jgi:predicted amidohydrolase